MNHHVIFEISTIIVSGIFAQWLAWKFHLPSILLLLLTGFIIGPLTNFINPDLLFGDLLFPFVSISVAIILFEGGLTLRINEVREAGSVVLRLITIGLLATWILSTLAAYYLLQIGFELSLLFGSILVVTGPTVVMPLLRFIRPKGQLNYIIKWEGILTDPIGAFLAVLVFEGLLAAGPQEATLLTILSLFKVILVGGGFGILAGIFMVFLLKRALIPEFLQNSVTLTLVVFVFVLTNSIQPESGLLAVTLMGIYLANQKQLRVKHIIEFKENLRVLLISILFIVLSARLELSDFEFIGLDSLLFLAILIFFIRPISVYLSTIKSNLNLKEKVFLSWMAPRGIVAAAVISLFALELSNKGFPEAESLIAYMFLVIVGTISIYGLTSMPLAKLLGITDSKPQGVLILGGNQLGIEIGKALQDLKFNVLIIDTNRENIIETQMAGIPAYFGNALSEYIDIELDLAGIGRFLALTPNDEINSLACLHFQEVFGVQNIYQLCKHDLGKSGNNINSYELRGKTLFKTGLTYERLIEHIESGGKVKSTKITDDFTFDNFLDFNNNSNPIPLFVVQDKNLSIIIEKDVIKPKTGNIIIALSKESQLDA